MKEKLKGGVRKGAGRKPSADPKQPITIFVETSKINRFGGKEGIQLFCYSAIEAESHDPEKKSPSVGLKFQKPIKGPKSLLPERLNETASFHKSAKNMAYNAPKLPADTIDEMAFVPGSDLPPALKTEASFVKEVKPKNLDELKALCPFPEKTEERSNWIRTERQKYGI